MAERRMLYCNDLKDLVLDLTDYPIDICKLPTESNTFSCVTKYKLSEPFNLSTIPGLIKIHITDSSPYTQMMGYRDYFAYISFYANISTGQTDAITYKFEYVQGAGGCIIIIFALKHNYLTDTYDSIYTGGLYGYAEQSQIIYRKEIMNMLI